MNFTFGTFITSLLFSSIIMIMISIFLRYHNFVNRKTIKFFLIGIFFCIFKLLFPIEFFFAKSFGIKKVLPLLYSFTKFKFLNNSIKMIHILIIIWLAVTIWKGIKSLQKYFHFYKLIGKLPNNPSQRERDILTELGIPDRKIKIVHIPNSSPCILGLWKPIIILPDCTLDNCELFYILKHEIQHYKHFDLWLKAFGEFVSVLYWWNPITIILQKQINIITEIDNDLSITQFMNSKQEIEYLRSMLKIAQYTNNTKFPLSVAFIENNQSQLRQRLNAISSPAKSYANLIVAIIISTLLLFSCIITLEPKYPRPVDDILYTEDEISTAPLVIIDDNYYVILNGQKALITNPNTIYNLKEQQE